MSADGTIASVTFDRETIQLNALQRAAYAVASLMTVDITESGDKYVCTLFPRDSAADPDILAHRIRSEVIDQTLRLRIVALLSPSLSTFRSRDFAPS
jgi:hypothetical protein